MRSPPSPARLAAYPVTGGIGLMAIAVTFMTGVIGEPRRWAIERFEVGPTAFRAEPWRLFTSVLPHLDVFHLAFNVYWLWVFGTLLEEVLGHARLLGLVALFAAGSMSAEFALSHGGVGLSGVGYGLFALLWVLSSRDRRFAGAIDARTAQIFALWFVVCIVATYTKVWAIANVAHGVGAVLGGLVGVAMSARARSRRVLAAAGVLVVLAASYAGATVLRPRVNLSHDSSASFQLGYQAIQEGRFDDAIRNYRDAVATRGDDAKAWHNLGVACENAGRGDDAVVAYRRSYQVDPHDIQHRDAYLGATHRFAAMALKKGDGEKAVALLREVVAVDPDDGVGWVLLAQSYQSLGRAAEAEQARSQVGRLTPDGGR